LIGPIQHSQLHPGHWAQNPFDVAEEREYALSGCYLQSFCRQHASAQELAISGSL